MLCQPLRQPNLIIPIEAVAGVLGELHVVRRIGVDDIVFSEPHRLEVFTRELPVLDDALQFREVAGVVYGPVLTEGHVEESPRVEAAQAVVAGAVQVVEEPCRFFRMGLVFFDERVEALSIAVIGVGAVGQRGLDGQAALGPLIEIDQVRINIV